jgi:hypothetical protein
VDYEQLPLRDLHLPDPISWWPPAIGWWLVAGMIILLAIVGWLVAWFLRKRRMRRNAIAEVRRVAALYQESGDPLEYVRRLSVVLRRIAISFHPREEVAGLSGEAWLDFLDRGVQGTRQHGGFSDGPGRTLIEAPYNPHCEVDVSRLDALCREWVNQVTQRRRDA